MTSPDRIAAVRRFNRFWTRQMGALESSMVTAPFSLTEARLICEVAQAESAPLVDLRSALRLDAGHATRVIGRLRREGLVTTHPASDDGRRQMVEITDEGRTAYRLITDRCNTQVASMLSRFSEREQQQLTDAMIAIELTVTGKTGLPVTTRALEPGDLGWVVQRHGALYSREQGRNGSFEASVARTVADFAGDRDHHAEDAWIAEMGRTPVGCVFCVREDAASARMRLLLVEPEARGRGVGTELVARCIAFAREAGYRRLVLSTATVLPPARRLFVSAGFRPTPVPPDRAAAPQWWELDLETTIPTRPAHDPA